MSKTLFALLVSAALILTGSFVGTGAATAATPKSVPWSDPNTDGFIGFCDASGHQIRSGTTMTFPFVRVAVSSTPPPAGYTAPTGRAVLYAYQPIQYVDPSDWSGMQMTGASAFSNNKAPMTEGLGIDPSIFNLSAGYPLHWNGLAQLRMYYTAPNKPEYSTTYPATAVQIVGKTWTQVGGGTVNCKSGAVLSNEHVLPNATKSNQPGYHPKPSKGASSSATVSGSSSGGASQSSSGSSGPSASTSPVSDATKSKSSSSSGFVIVLVVVLVLITGGGYWAIRRRRGSAV